MHARRRDGTGARRRPFVGTGSRDEIQYLGERSFDLNRPGFPGDRFV
jgi:hypothetical protein